MAGKRPAQKGDILIRVTEVTRSRVNRHKTSTLFYVLHQISDHLRIGLRVVRLVIIGIEEYRIITTQVPQMDILQITCIKEFNAPVEHRRSEEHTSELQSRGHLVCRLLLEKKNL